MAFTRAITVSPDDGLNSRHQRSVARAANDRLRFATDMPWRVAWALYNGSRLVRNPASDGLTFPAEGEFWKIFAHLKSASGYDWPLVGPGEPEGANLGSVTPQFIFGNTEISNEPERIGALFPIAIDGLPPVTTADKWVLGKLQRGAITSDGSAQYVPAFEAAQTLFRFAFHPSIFHGKSYGGWQPQAPQDETYPLCAPDGFPGDRTPNRHYAWTGLATDTPTTGLHGTITTDGEGRPVVTYSGSCPCGTTYSGTGHVLYIADLPFAWYVYVSDGTVTDGVCGVNVDRLDKAQWAEGPYAGAPALQHSDYPVILRTAWRYIAEFSGANSQRTPDSFDIESIAFDSQRFYTRQYPLAPAYGEVGETGIEAIYPSVTILGNEDIVQFNTLSDMRGITSVEWAAVTDHQAVILAGITAPGDYGFSLYIKDAASTETDDGFYIVKPTVVSGAGRFIRAIANGQPVVVNTWGAIDSLAVKLPHGAIVQTRGRDSIYDGQATRWIYLTDAPSATIDGALFKQLSTGPNTGGVFQNLDYRQ